MSKVETGSDVIDRAVAMWLSLESCRRHFDDDIAEELTAALAAIDEAVQLAHTLPASKRGAWLEDIVAPEAMVEAIYAYVHISSALDKDR
jgi:hypothetical protein